MKSDAPKLFFYPDPALHLAEKCLVISRSPTVIGRNPSQDITLLIDSVSRSHLKLECINNNWIITDLDSSNGTFLNNERVSRAALHNGDRLRLGNAEFFVSESEDDHFIVQDNDKIINSGIQILDDEKMESTIVTVQEPLHGSAFYSAIVEKDSPSEFKKTARRLSAVYRMNDLLKSPLNRLDIYRGLLELAFESVPAERGIILERSQNNDEFTPLVRHFKDSAKTSDFLISRTILQQTFTEGNAILSRNIRQDNRFASSESIMYSEFVNVMSVPAVANGKVYAVLFLDSTQMDLSFNEEDLAFVNSLATDVAMTLSNLELTEENIRNARMAAMGETVAGLAHNIKNILQIARGGMDLMDDAISRNSMDDVAAFWPLTKRGIERMQELTMEMLDFSRTAKPTLSLFLINEILTDIAENFVPKSKVKFHCKLCSEVGYHRVNYDYLQKAILNLLTNAVDAVAATGGECVLSSERAENKTLIRVHNSGPAIPPEIQINIFKPFFTTKGSQGNGFGLSMTRKYIEDMGGTLNFQSDESCGTTFYISLPDIEDDESK